MGMGGGTGPIPVTCRICGHGPYVPSFVFDFYPDDQSHPEIGICEACFMKKAMEPKAPVNIPEENVTKICGLGKGSETCRFLIAGGPGFQCAKGSTIYGYIQSRAETMRAKGDNCSGPPEFKPL